MVTFAEPVWLFAGIFFCFVIYYILRLLESKKTEHLSRFASVNLLKTLTRNNSPNRWQAKKACLFLALYFCFVAFARPQYGTEWVEVQKRGVDIVFAIDTSKSMLAEDMVPSRLERTKLAIIDFVSRLDGDRVGLIPFAGAAYLMCPLTLDYQAFIHSLLEVNVGVIPRGGTNLAEAILTTESILTDDDNHKFLILLSDGENHLGDIVEASTWANKKNLTVFTVGVGTESGAYIPDISSGLGDYQKDAYGEIVTSKLHSNLLENLADKTGGIYTPLGTMGEGLSLIYNEKIKRAPPKETNERLKEVPIERFNVPLGGALVLLCVDFVLSRRRSGQLLSYFSQKQNKIHFPQGYGKVLLLAGCIILIIAVKQGLTAEGFKAYKNGDFDQALEFYREKIKVAPDAPLLRYNYGAVAYKKQLYGAAISSFRKALDSNDLSLQKKIYYNLGAAQFQRGKEFAEKEKTIGFWQQAINSFSSSLKLDPDNEHALYNKKYIEIKLKELRKKRAQYRLQEEENTQEDTLPNTEYETVIGKDAGGSGKEPEKSDMDPPIEKNSANNQEFNNPADKRNPDQSPQLQLTAGKKQKDRTPDDEQKALVKEHLQEYKKMEQDEAETLFNAMRNDEETLVFIPVTGETNNEKPMKDW